MRRKYPGSVGRLYNELSNFEPVVLKQCGFGFSSRLHDDMADADTTQEVTHRQCKGLCAQELQKCGPGLDDTCKELGVS